MFTRYKKDHSILTIFHITTRYRNSLGAYVCDITLYFYISVYLSSCHAFRYHSGHVTAITPVLEVLLQIQTPIAASRGIDPQHNSIVHTNHYAQ